ncbi:3407_t:CDS:2, partial [Racocetra fulgida]
MNNSCLQDVKDFFENNSNSEIILKQEKIHASEYRAEIRITFVVETIYQISLNAFFLHLILLLSRILTNLRRNWDTKEDQKLREWKHNTTLLDQKAKEYQLKLSRLERQYDAMNIEGGGLRFQDLKNKEEQVEALEHLVKDKAKKLKTYQ